MRAWAAGVELIVLHALAGNPVFVNPRQIVSMVKPRDSAVVTDKAECAITLADGKFLTVSESCEQVRELVEKQDGGKPQ